MSPCNILSLDGFIPDPMDAEILEAGKDEKGPYLLFDQTIFYPQGGGQPSDYGIIKGRKFTLDIVDVRRVQPRFSSHPSHSQIRHYLKKNVPPTDIDKALYDPQIQMEIDRDARDFHSRYHTAAHLISNIVQDLYPTLTAMKAHAFPNEGYVEFEGTAVPESAPIADAIKQAIADEIQTAIFEIDRIAFEEKFYKLPYPIPTDKPFRVVQIGDFMPIPCGGTHVSCLGQLSEVTLDKIKIADTGVRISYSLIDNPIIY